MGTPLGDFVRAKRDTTRPEDVGLPVTGRRRAPGMRRAELAGRAGISVEYLTRLEQGRDRNPSPAVVQALCEALALAPAEREHLRYLTKITGGACAGHRAVTLPSREVRPAALRTLALLDSAAAMIGNRLGDVLAWTSGFERLVAGTGLLTAAEPNLTRWVFTDPAARTVLPEWDAVADECAFELWHAPTVTAAERFRAELAPVAGAEFSRRLANPLRPEPRPWRFAHPSGVELRIEREVLELAEPDAQQLIVLHPADAATERAWAGLLVAPAALRVV